MVFHLLAYYYIAVSKSDKHMVIARLEEACYSPNFMFILTIYGAY